MQQTVNHRVKIMPESSFDGRTEFIVAYSPHKDNNGNILANESNILFGLNRLGGVKVGSEGEIRITGYKAARSALANQTLAPSLGLDTVNMICVYLFEYQKEAWFDSMHVKVIAS